MASPEVVLDNEQPYPSFLILQLPFALQLNPQLIVSTHPSVCPFQPSNLIVALR
jgi:hypothetical protein